MAFAGADLEPLRQRLLDRLARDENDANAAMDLSIVLQLMGQRDLGLAVQALALQNAQIFRVRCASDVPSVRLLAIVSPGDLTQNNALEFLVESSDIELNLLYVGPDLPLPSTLPEHDMAMVAVCETDRNRPLLDYIGKLLKWWPRPVLCAPDKIARLSRDGACACLKPAPGIVVPPTARISRAALRKIAKEELSIEDFLPGAAFPIIARPVDSQKGFGLAKLETPAAVAEYLQTRLEHAFYVAPFVDYRGTDGQFRKYRILLIGGRPYACHMAISDHWMVHYVRAGMLENTEKRAEEAQFFASFDNDFARRHHDALCRIATEIDLEYVGIDCGETPDGRLLIFEVDSGMTVHAMDPVDIFPYKQPQMHKVFRAFREMLIAHHSQAQSARTSLLFTGKF
ncbi:MAG: RimK family alpha-L-glutamate ligase [Acidobacteriia bacterium]|nr:RimK family alpha-L-glutamate ligase [Terriglobia bacterium]